MIICNNCGHQNLPGTIFCVECGTQLDGSKSMTTGSIPTDQLVKNLKEDTSTPTLSPPSPPTDSWLSLHFMDGGKVLPLASNRNEFTMGRLSEGQPIMPDVDLMPYQAYTAGVSRLHAVIKRINNKVLIMDLGSSNGTYVNGRRISPHAEEAIIHGDIVALGKMKIQILIRDN